MNNWDLQSNQTASGESNLSVSEWFNHLITPPSKRHVLELFDGTTHLVEKRDQRCEAFLQITGQKSTVSGSSATNFLPLQENLNFPAALSTDLVFFPININFLFYVPV
jgi:hypothetical protein